MGKCGAVYTKLLSRLFSRHKTQSLQPTVYLEICSEPKLLFVAIHKYLVIKCTQLLSRSPQVKMGHYDPRPTPTPTPPHSLMIADFIIQSILSSFGAYRGCYWGLDELGQLPPANNGMRNGRDFVGPVPKPKLLSPLAPRYCVEIVFSASRRATFPFDRSSRRQKGQSVFGVKFSAVGCTNAFFFPQACRLVLRWFENA